MSDVQVYRAELKKAEQAMEKHKQTAYSGDAEWRGTWDNGYWCGHNSTDLNRIYSSLYIKIVKAREQVENAMCKLDPYRRDLDATIESLKEQRITSAKDNVQFKPFFNPLFDRLVMVISRNMNYDIADKYAESLCVCTHYFQSRKTPCDCIPDEIGFLSLSKVNEERLKNNRVCFIGNQEYGTGANFSKPIRGPVKPGKGLLRIQRHWVKELKILLEKCEHYHQRLSNQENETKEMVACDCIKRSGFHQLNPDNIWIKNQYYIIESRLPITISRNYQVNGVSYQGSDTFSFECNHYINIVDCLDSEISKQCDCKASGELSEKLNKFDIHGLVKKKFYNKELNAMANIRITRETRGLIPHPQGHICRHEREDGCSMECDCIPLFNKHTVERFEDVVYDLSDDMKKRQSAGRVSLAYEGKLHIGGFFKQVFFPSSKNE